MVRFPCNGSVMGQSVAVSEIDYDGNERWGLTARCRRREGAEHVVAAEEYAGGNILCLFRHSS
jgi:hypothetical protein